MSPRAFSNKRAPTVVAKGSKRNSPERDLSRMVMRSIKSTYRNRCHMRVTDPEMKQLQDGSTIRDDRNIGRPDLVGHIYGIHVEIELKAGSYPSDDQKREITTTHSTGGLACLIVHKRTGKKSERGYYFVPAAGVTRFSYRTMNGWLPMDVIEHNGKEFLDLSILSKFILIHAAGLVQHLHQPQDQ